MAQSSRRRRRARKHRRRRSSSPGWLRGSLGPLVPKRRAHRLGLAARCARYSHQSSRLPRRSSRLRSPERVRIAPARSPPLSVVLSRPRTSVLSRCGSARSARTPSLPRGERGAGSHDSGPATTTIRGRATQRHPVSSVVSESGNISGGSSLDTSLPSASTIPRRSNRARALASRAAASSARRRRHSTRSSSRSRSRSSKRASGIGAALADAATTSACPTWTRQARTPASSAGKSPVHIEVQKSEKPCLHRAFQSCAGPQLDFPALQFQGLAEAWVPFEEAIVIGWR